MPFKRTELKWIKKIKQYPTVCLLQKNSLSVRDRQTEWRTANDVSSKQIQAVIAVLISKQENNQKWRNSLQSIETI